MGIHNLTSLIKKHAPESIHTESISSLKGKRLGIDASIFIYKSLAGMRYNGDYLKNDDKKVVSHIIGIFYKTISYISVGAIPIYIFDGKPPESKRETIQERNKKASEALDSISSTMSKADIEKNEKKSIRLTSDIIMDIKKLLTMMGVTYIHPDGEAEAYASELCRIGYIDCVVTEDMDTLVFESPNMIRSCIDRSIKRPDTISRIDLSVILKKFEMTHKEFTDMCILCGCDYCPTIKSVGSQTSYNLIQKYKTIESILELQKYTDTDTFREKYQIARETFNIYKDKINLDSIIENTSVYEKQKLEEFLIKDCKMSDKRVQNSLKKITQCSI